MGFQKLTTGILSKLYKNTKEYNIPRDVKSDIKYNCSKFDVIAFDANAFYYMIASLYTNIQIEQMSLATVSIILRIVKQNINTDMSSKKLIIISFDGSPPASKLAAQITRRLDDEETENKYIYIEELEKYKNHKIEYRDNNDKNGLKKPIYKKIDEINKNTHSSFKTMQRYVTYCYKLLIGVAQVLKMFNLTIYFHIETSKTPGEGEHKIFDYLINQNYFLEKNKLIISDDSDIFLIAASRMPLSKITILRRTIGIDTNKIPEVEKIKDHTTETLLNTMLKDFYYFMKKILNGKEDAAVTNLIMLYKDSADLNRVYSIQKILGLSIYASVIYSNKCAIITNIDDDENSILKKFLSLTDIKININISYQYLELIKFEFYILHKVGLKGDFDNMYKEKSKTLKSGMRDIIRRNCVFLIVLLSFIGNDFTATRYDICPKYMINYIDDIFNNNKRPNHISRFVDIIDCSIKNRQAFFPIVKFKMIMEEFFVRIPIVDIVQPMAIISHDMDNFLYRKKQDSKNDMDKALTIYLNTTSVDIVKLYFQSIVYTVEYIINGVEGGNKSFYSTLPWAPSMYLIQKVLTNYKDSLSPITLVSLQNKHITSSINFMKTNNMIRSNLWYSITQISKIDPITSSRIKNYMIDSQIADIFKLEIGYIYIKFRNLEFVRSNLNIISNDGITFSKLIERSLRRYYPCQKTSYIYCSRKEYSINSKSDVNVFCLRMIIICIHRLCFQGAVLF